MEVHVLASGSDGNCTVVRNDDEVVMVDAGLSCKQLVELMGVEGIDPSSVKALLLTHEHTDHIMGARVLCKKYDIPVYSTIGTFEGFDHGNADFTPIFGGQTFSVCGMDVTALPTSHDAADPTAFTLAADGKRVSIITDTGILTEPCQRALHDSDLAILEANYDEDMLTANRLYTPALKRRIRGDHGHLCNLDTGRWVSDTFSNKQRKLFLAHLSRKNNTPDLARETVAKLSGVPRSKIDCLEFKGDTRTLRL